MSPPALPVVVVGATDVGRHRDNNEDALGEVTAPDGARLILVADGMGGFEAGELASAAAIEGALRAWQAPGGGGVASRLTRAFEAANQQVIEVANQQGHLGRMGTTMVAMAVADGQVTLGHVGDSRAYLLRGGQLHRQTRDHTEAQELVERGELTPEQAERDARGHYLTRALGLDLDVDLEVSAPHRIQPGDTWLLCSDGLTGPVDDETVQSALRFLSPTDAVTGLIREANYNGGPDNITVYIVRFGADAALEPRPSRYLFAHEGAALRAVGCALLLLLLVGMLLVLWWMFG